MILLIAAAKATHTAVQWSTLVWIVGAIVAATVIIAAIVVVSRRPQSMEDGMAEFSRSLQAVAPAHRPGPRPVPAHPRLGSSKAQEGSSKAQEERPARATRGETEPV
jgi:hypothetical protein